MTLNRIMSTELLYFVIQKLHAHSMQCNSIPNYSFYSILFVYFCLNHNFYYSTFTTNIYTRIVPKIQCIWDHCFAIEFKTGGICLTTAKIDSVDSWKMAKQWPSTTDFWIIQNHLIFYNLILYSTSLKHSLNWWKEK